ncbi:DUF29 family protein [Nostoc sp. DedQUE09]
MQERDLEHFNWDYLIDEIERLGHEQKYQLKIYLLPLKCSCVA